MVLMALDHTRDFFHAGAIHGLDPLAPAHTTPALFFTRWITGSPETGHVVNRESVREHLPRIVTKAFV